jgi:hypothetical protein
MIHTDRAFGITEVSDVKTLANQLFHYTWTGCTGYQLGEYLFLNDSFSEDGKQEFAVLKIDDGELIQIETITISCTKLTERLLELALTIAMDSHLNMGAYNELKLEDISEHQCDICE